MYCWIILLCKQKKKVNKLLSFFVNAGILNALFMFMIKYTSVSFPCLYLFVIVTNHSLFYDID